MSKEYAESWKTPRFPTPSCGARQGKQWRFGKIESGWVFIQKCQAEWKTSLVVQTVKTLSAMQETGFDPWVGKIAWRRGWEPIPVFLPGEFHRQGSLVWRVRHDWATNTTTFFSILNGDAAQPSFSGLLECCQPGLYLQIEEDQRIFQKETRKARKKMLNLKLSQ